MKSLVEQFHPYFMRGKLWEKRFGSLDASIGQQARNKVESKVRYRVADVIGHIRYPNDDIQGTIRLDIDKTQGVIVHDLKGIE